MVLHILKEIKILGEASHLILLCLDLVFFVCLGLRFFDFTFFFLFFLFFTSFLLLDLLRQVFILRKQMMRTKSLVALIQELLCRTRKLIQFVD